MLDWNIALCLFVWLFVSRYLRTAVSIFTWILYKPKPISEKPTYRSEDVTVIVPTTFKSPGELVQCLKGIMACSPAITLVVTSHENVELVKTCCAPNSFGTKVKVLGVEKLNKRKQILRAMKEVKTEITVFADDDVFWPANYLDYLLAIFENPDVGAGGTRQRVRRNRGAMNFWNFLGICYLERRVWNNVTTNAIDGSISTLSGRTAAYRTEILDTTEFFYYFQNDSWLGRPLNSDDDKCLTRYVYAHGWQIALQCDERAIIETTLEDNPKYIHQCIRWARAHWRGNFTVMTNESYWRSPRFWWGTYVIFAGQFQTPALLVDGLLLALLGTALQSAAQYQTLQSAAQYQTIGQIILALWIVFTKILKLLPHLRRRPEDIKYLPLSILFSYLHGFINIYALLTLHITTWGSQNLEQLKSARAENDEVVPLLRRATNEADPYCEPTPGRLMVGDDYFSVRPMTSRQAYMWNVGVSPYGTY